MVNSQLQLVGRLQEDPQPCCPREQRPDSTYTCVNLVISGSKHKTHRDGPVVHSVVPIHFHGGAAGVVQRYLRKGDKILVNGKVKSRRKSDGTHEVIIVGKNVMFLHLMNHGQQEE